MSTNPQKVKPPADPDPTPTVTSSSTAEMQSVARDERKRMAKAYGRQNTILTGNTELLQRSESGSGFARTCCAWCKSGVILCIPQEIKMTVNTRPEF